MTKKTAFWIFLLGTISSAVLFLAATWDTQRQGGTLSKVDQKSAQDAARGHEVGRETLDMR